MELFRPRKPSLLVGVIMNRKSVRKNSFKTFKASYFKNIIVAFIVIVILDGGYLYSTKNIIKDNNINIDTIKNNIYLDTDLTSQVVDPEKIVDLSKVSELNERASSKLSNSGDFAELFFNVFKNNKKISEFRNNVQESRQSYLSKYNEGVISTVINDITSTRISFGFINTINIFMNEHNIKAFVLSLVFTSVSIMFFFLVKDVVEVGKNRYYLEQRRYYESKVDKILFPYRVKKTKHIAWVLLNKYLFQGLWNLTVIGGFIKAYEYMYIPYVLAENPNISRKDAFRLSKELTRGNKWNLFVLDLSFFWCHILGSITLNLTNLFFYNGYKECVDAESYMQIRKEKLLEWNELIDENNSVDERKVNREYYAKLIPLLNDEYLDIDEAKNEEYPEEYYIIPKKEHRHWLKVDYKKDYSIVNYILFFFIFSFIGYSWEVFLYLVRDGVLVNRGSMYGPWLPIYGSGGVAILVLLKKYRDKPIVLFFATMLLCGLIEYVGGWFLETFKGLKYWDYSTYFFNIQGRVCLECSIVFGLGGCGFMYILAPICDNILNKISLKHRKYLAIVLVSLFGLDFLYSTMNPNVGEGITSKIETSDKLKETMNE